jgi:hypothetical protein
VPNGGVAPHSKSLGAGTDAMNLARADGFKKMVDAVGKCWPDAGEG